MKSLHNNIDREDCPVAALYFYFGAFSWHIRLGLAIPEQTEYAANYDTNADPVFDELADRLPELSVIVSDQPFEYVNQIRRLDPDIVLVHSGYNAVPSKLGYLTIPEFDVGGSYFGFSGVYQVAKKIAFALGNGSYFKHLGDNYRSPYKSEWYDRDPFSYHKK